MNVLSVCTGIGAPELAWEPLGWNFLAFAEIEPFPCAVLHHHHGCGAPEKMPSPLCAPTAKEAAKLHAKACANAKLPARRAGAPRAPRNLGDMRQIDGREFLHRVDVLVGGPPCQSFSVAGLRGGLADPRGNLLLEFVRIADECDPSFTVLENVPGLLSDRGNAFGSFLAALAGETSPLEPPGGKWTDAGYVLGPRRAVAWRVFDAQYFGLAQRRRRVFVVGCPRDGADPREILFEFDGLRRDTAPRRGKGQDVAGALESGLGRSRGAGTPPGAVVAFGGGRCSGSIDVAPRLGCNDSGSGFRLDFESDALIVGTLGANGKAAGSVTQQDAECGMLVVASSLRGEGHDASEDGTGRQNLVVSPPLTHKPHCDNASREEGLVVSYDSYNATESVDVTGTLRSGDGSSGPDLLPLVLHGSQDPDTSVDLSHPVGRNQGQENCVFSVAMRGREGGVNVEMGEEGLANALRGAEGGRSGEGPGAVLHRSRVRRLMPVCCERLQGFPDDYTLIPSWSRKKPGKSHTYPDGPRYMSLGNAMPVNVLKWIGARIEWHVRLHGKGVCPSWCPCSSGNIPLEYNSPACRETRAHYAPEYGPAREAV